MKFTLATCVRNEGPYLLEWVAHYKLLGFDRIVIYSNDNTDGSDELLAQMEKEQLIEWRPRTLAAGQSPQLSAYKAFSKELFDDANEHGGYLAWFDCDEFLVLKQHSSIQELLAFYSFPDALFVNWKHFGSAGKQKYECELTLSRFLACDSITPHNTLGKSISRISPHIYSFISNHKPILIKNDVLPRIIYASDKAEGIPVKRETICGKHQYTGSPIFHNVCQLNHYAIRSKEEYSWKSARGNGRLSLDADKAHFKAEYFRAHDLNNEKDVVAVEKYETAIKNYLKLLPAKLIDLEAQIIKNIVKDYRSTPDDSSITGEIIEHSEFPIDKPKALFILRCHSFGEAESFLLNTVLPYFGKDNILIVADERSQNVNVHEWRKVSLTHEKLQNMELLNHPNCGWLCGDYFFYLAYDAQPDYEYYWLCEPDVYFSFNQIEDFFKEFDENSADLLAPLFRKRDNNWAWTKKAKIISDDVYGCLFPITRISQKAVKHLYEERRKLTHLFESKKMKAEKWPNDESFVSTVLQRDGFICQNLSLISSFFDSNFNSGQTFILRNALLDRVPSNKTLHPVLSATEFQNRVGNRLKRKNFMSLINEYLSNNIFPNATADVSFDVTLDTLNIIYKEIKSTLLKSYPNLSNDRMQQFDIIFQKMQLATDESQSITIIHPLKIAFPSVPKVGSTSLFNWIYELIYKEKYSRKKNIHDWFKSQNNEIIENKILKQFSKPNNYFIFCVVRDPVKRLLSAYSNRVSYYKELNFSRIWTDDKENDLAANPSLNYFIDNLENYQSCSESIFHHTKLLIDFIGKDISIYDHVFDLSDLNELRQTLIEHWHAHHLISQDHEIPELPRLQTKGRKFSLGDLTASSFEKCLELYNCDYKVIPMLDINKIREEWQNSNVEAHTSELINKIEAKINPIPNIVEFTELFRKKISVAKGEIESISGLVLLKPDAENVYKLIAQDMRGEWQLQWKLSSSNCALKYPNNPHAINAKFKTQSLQINSQNPVRIFIEDNLKKRHLLFVISAEKF